MPDKVDVLIVELRGEIEHLIRLSSEAMEVLPRYSLSSPPTPFEMRALAALIAEFYSGVEFAMQRGGDRLDEGLPRGGNWHRALLDQMSLPLPDVRPALFGSDTVALLETFRQFRHIARHRYGESLEWESVFETVQRLDAAVKAVVGDLENFCVFLEAVSREQDA